MHSAPRRARAAPRARALRKPRRGGPRPAERLAAAGHPAPDRRRAGRRRPRASRPPPAACGPLPLRHLAAAGLLEGSFFGLRRASLWPPAPVPQRGTCRGRAYERQHVDLDRARLGLAQRAVVLAHQVLRDVGLRLVRVGPRHLRGGVLALPAHEVHDAVPLVDLVAEQAQHLELLAAPLGVPPAGRVTRGPMFSWVREQMSSVPFLCTAGYKVKEGCAHARSVAGHQHGRARLGECAPQAFRRKAARPW
jgi:hypothetical protein